MLVQHLGRVHKGALDRLGLVDRAILQFQDALATRAQEFQEHNQRSIQEHGLGSE